MNTMRPEVLEREKKNATIDANRVNYVRAQYFLTELRSRYRRKEITPKDYQSLRNLAINGDLDSAIRVLGSVLKK